MANRAKFWVAFAIVVLALPCSRATWSSTSEVHSNGDEGLSKQIRNGNESNAIAQKNMFELSSSQNNASETPGGSLSSAPSVPFTVKSLLTSEHQLQQVQNSTLTTAAVLQSGRLLIARHPAFGDRLVLAKIASSADDMASLWHEVAFYRHLSAQRITPELLGIIIGEQATAIGFITEYIDRRPDDSGSAKTEPCLNALHLMHRSGVAHGDAHAENCLLRDSTTAVLIDFELSLITTSEDEFERDISIMVRTTQG